MPILESLTAGVLLVALTFYALFGGADFGAGVWDLLAFGPRRQAQRALIADAIGPIWEANHVWLILAIVILFNAFPPAFAVLSTALYIPLTIMLVGIVLRGATFMVRSYDTHTDDASHGDVPHSGPPPDSGRWWGRLFAIASIVTPLMLGICIGAISSGNIRVENGIVTTGFVASWWAPFPLAVGAFALVIFAFLAAVYLTVEADEPALRDDFRARALLAAVALGFLALLVFVLAGEGAPRVRAGLIDSPWSWPLQIITGLSAVGAIGSLWTRRFYLARAFAAAQVALILWGWGAAQFPYLVAPDITIRNAAAPPVTLQLLLTFLTLGAVILFPSFYLLFRIFKGERAFAISADFADPSPSGKGGSPKK